MSEKIPANPDVVAEDKTLEKSDHLSEKDNLTTSENEDGDFSDSEGENTDGENENTSSVNEGELRRVYGERGKLLIESLKDSPEKLKAVLEQDSDLKRKASKWGVDVEALFGTDTENSSENVSEKTSEPAKEILLLEDEVNAVIGKQIISASNRVKIETKAKEILATGVVSNKSVAIKTALAELGLSKNALDTNSLVGAVSHGGGVSVSEQKLLPLKEFSKLRGEERRKYKEVFGNKTL